MGLTEDDSDREEGALPARRHYQPAWAGGLRALYNAVVEEALPDSFADLLAKLDEPPAAPPSAPPAD